MREYSPVPVQREDKLKDVTDKDITVITHLERLENLIWLDDKTIIINGKEEKLNRNDFETFEKEKEYWKSWFNEASTSETWKDGKHFGDCTKIPMTCVRCLCEDKLENARKFIAWFNNSYNYDKF